MTEIEIDLNVRVRGNWTFVGFEDVSGALPSVGDSVRVHESESGLKGAAIVTAIDREREILYLAVNWRELSRWWEQS